MRKFGRTDTNHTDIRRAVEKIGWSAWSTASLGDGFPDLICAKAKRTVLLEIKDGSRQPSKRKLTDDEREFFAHWPGECYLVESIDDALRVLR